MSVAFRAACNLEAQEQLIADAIAGGVRVTVLPEYTPKPRPAHTVKSWKVMGLPKPKPIKKPIDKPKCNHDNSLRRLELLKYLKRVGVMTSCQIRDKFGYTNPGKAIERINNQHDRPVIAIKKAGKAANNHPMVFYQYIG